MANIKEVKLTADGLKKYEEELDYLKSQKRKEIADKIKVALSFGDLSENSEYDEAKNEQAQVEGRILELEAMLKNVVIIDESEDTDIVKIGGKVKLLDMELDSTDEYQIVGSTEADPMYGSISDESPVGRSVLGHKVGDMVDVEAPGGVIRYKVLEIIKAK